MTKDEYWEKYNSETLCINFSNKFDIWWDPKKFDWYQIVYLFKYVSYKANIWCKPEIVNSLDYHDIYFLVTYTLHNIINWYNCNILELKIYTILYINKMEWDYD